MLGHRPLERRDWPPGIGPAWRELLDELARRLDALDDRCFIWRVDVEGFLHVSVECPPEVRPRARTLVGDVERRSASICETCGEPAALRAGVMPEVLCPECAET